MSQAGAGCVHNSVTERQSDGLCTGYLLRCKPLRAASIRRPRWRLFILMSAFCMRVTGILFPASNGTPDKTLGSRHGTLAAQVDNG
jgi:hypothetical protein